MKLIRIAALAAALCAGVRAECAAGSLVVIVNPANATDSVSVAQLRKLMLGEVKSWPDHKAVAVVHRAAATPAFQCMLSEVLRMTEAEYKRYQLNAQFRGDDLVAPKVSETGASAANLVATLPGGITVIEADVVHSFTRPVKVVRVDGKQAGEAGYPF